MNSNRSEFGNKYLFFPFISLIKSTCDCYITAGKFVLYFLYLLFLSNCCGINFRKEQLGLVNDGNF